MAQLKDTIVNGDLTVTSSIKKNGKEVGTEEAINAIRTDLGNGNLKAKEAKHATNATNADEATHAANATNADEATHATNSSQLGGIEAINYTLKSELIDGTVKPQISKSLEDVGNVGTNWGIDYTGNSGTTARNWWCAFDNVAKNIVPVEAPINMRYVRKYFWYGKEGYYMEHAEKGWYLLYKENSGRPWEECFIIYMSMNGKDYSAGSPDEECPLMGYSNVNHWYNEKGGPEGWFKGIFIPQP